MGRALRPYLSSTRDGTAALGCWAIWIVSAFGNGTPPWVLWVARIFPVRHFALGLQVVWSASPSTGAMS